MVIVLYFWARCDAIVLVFIRNRDGKLGITSSSERGKKHSDINVKWNV